MAAGKSTGRVEIGRYPSARDEEVEAILHYPLKYKENERFPLMLEIHGGPAGTDLNQGSQSSASPVLLWRQRGAFVLQVNYHGSAGYGLGHIVVPTGVGCVGHTRSAVT